MIDLDRLADRVEHLLPTVIDRRLDEEIAETLGWTLVDKVERLWLPPGQRDWATQAPCWTFKLDDALEALPKEAVWWEVGKVCSETSVLRGFGGNSGTYAAKVGLTWGETTATGNGATGAAALYAAALRATAKTKPRETAR